MPGEKASLTVTFNSANKVGRRNQKVTIEANTDHISMERHPLAKRAKDMGSAAVFLTIVIALSVWGTVLWQRFA